MVNSFLDICLSFTPSGTCLGALSWLSGGQGIFPAKAAKGCERHQRCSGQQRGHRASKKAADVACLGHHCQV